MIVEDPQHCEISELHMSLYRRTDGRTASLALQTEGEAHGRPPRSVQKQSREGWREGLDDEGVDIDVENGVNPNTHRVSSLKRSQSDAYASGILKIHKEQAHDWKT